MKGRKSILIEYFSAILKYGEVGSVGASWVTRMLFTFRILSSKTASVISAQIGVSVSEENLDDDYQWYDFRDTKVGK
jgi:hypothetical protein